MILVRGGGKEGHMVFRGEIGRDQSSPTDLTANKKGGHKISALWRDQENFIVTQSKSSDPLPLPTPPLPRR